MMIIVSKLSQNFDTIKILALNCNEISALSLSNLYFIHPNTFSIGFKSGK